MRPPRPMPARNVEIVPAVNARIRNNEIWNIGCSTRVSMMAKAASSPIPARKEKMTVGLVHPMVWPP